MTKFRWVAEPVPDEIIIRQVYGFCFDKSGLLLLREDEGEFSLPGGKPEAGEDSPAVLARECLEESQIVISSAVYLGYQEVTEEGDQPAFAQLRMAALIERFLPREPDPDTGRIYRRLLTPVIDAPRLLNWGMDGLLQSAAAAIAAREQLGVDPDAPRAQVYRDLPDPSSPPLRSNIDVG